MSKPITAWHNHDLDCSRWIISHVLGLGPSSQSTLLADTWTRAKQEMPTGPAEAATQGSFYTPLSLHSCLCFSAASSSVIPWPQMQVIPVSLPAQTLRCPGTTFSGSPWFYYFTPAVSCAPGVCQALHLQCHSYDNLLVPLDWERFASGCMHVCSLLSDSFWSHGL